MKFDIMLSSLTRILFQKRSYKNLLSNISEPKCLYLSTMSLTVFDAFR